jgi:hypothetical protein
VCVCVFVCACVRVRAWPKIYCLMNRALKYNSNCLLFGKFKRTSRNEILDAQCTTHTYAMHFFRFHGTFKSERCSKYLRRSVAPECITVHRRQTSLNVQARYTLNYRHSSNMSHGCVRHELANRRVCTSAVAGTSGYIVYSNKNNIMRRTTLQK